MTKSNNSIPSAGEKLIGEFIGMTLMAVFFPDEFKSKTKQQVPAVITNDVTAL